MDRILEEDITFEAERSHVSWSRKSNVGLFVVAVVIFHIHATSARRRTFW